MFIVTYAIVPMLFLMDSHELISNALEANKAHQSALAAYAQTLNTEIHEIDKLLVSTLLFSTQWQSHILPFLTDAMLTLENCDDGYRSSLINVRGNTQPASVVQSSLLLKPVSEVAILWQISKPVN
jgi:hypothetical protein